MIVSGQELEIVARLLTATVMGGLIGLEREHRARPAGLRTFMLVTLGAALFTVMSIYGFIGEIADPGRVAAQIVTGIGFLGAAVVFRSGRNVYGLTSAATVWVAAAIGMAAGAGFYLIAGATTLIVLLVLAIVRRWEHALGWSSSDMDEREREE